MFGKPKDPLSEEEAKELRFQVARAVKAQEFLDGEFWIKYFGPFLRNDQLDCMEKGRYRGGAWPGAEAVAFQSVYNGAQADHVDRIREELKIWIIKGKEAADELRRDEERRKIA